MKPYSLDSGFQVLFEDGERVLRRRPSVTILGVPTPKSALPSRSG